MRKTINLVGNRYGMLTVIEQRGSTTSKNAIWFCRCDCGGFALVAAGDLRRDRKDRKGGGGTKSCGCLRKTEPAKSNKRHGMFGTRIYNTWSGMRNRCENSSHRSARNYHDRGISVCEEWLKFDAFYSWAMNNGYNDSLTIDRIDNDLGYNPENCRFVTMFEQQSNKRNNAMLTAMGETKTKAQWSRDTGIDQGTLGSRLKRGWSVSVALSTPAGEKPCL